MFDFAGIESGNVVSNGEGGTEHGGRQTVDEKPDSLRGLVLAAVQLPAATFPVSCLTLPHTIALNGCECSSSLTLNSRADSHSISAVQPINSAKLNSTCHNGTSLVNILSGIMIGDERGNRLRNNASAPSGADSTLIIHTSGDIATVVSRKLIRDACRVFSVTAPNTAAIAT